MLRYRTKSTSPGPQVAKEASSICQHPGEGAVAPIAEEPTRAVESMGFGTAAAAVAVWTPALRDEVERNRRVDHRCFAERGCRDQELDWQVRKPGALRELLPAGVAKQAPRATSGAIPFRSTPACLVHFRVVEAHPRWHAGQEPRHRAAIAWRRCAPAFVRDLGTTTRDSGATASLRLTGTTARDSGATASLRLTGTTAPTTASLRRTTSFSRPLGVSIGSSRGAVLGTAWERVSRFQQNEA